MTFLIEEIIMHFPEKV